MKKIILSTVAIATMSISGAYADTSSDIAEMKAMMKQMSQRLAKLEAENTQLKATQTKQAKQVRQVQTKQKSSKDVVAVAAVEAPAESKYAKVKKHKVPLLQFDGKHYLGFVSSKADGKDRSNQFETRRNYLQVKGYFGDNSKNFFRITLDTFQNTGEDDAKDADSWEVRLKYAYLYLDNVLPFTGVEIGQAHRPWIDYEEHGGWNYRSIAKVFVEQDNGAHLTNSADLGINFKTKMDYFSSELGVFNGEGYHDNDPEGNKVSAEWRLTGHILGTGKEKRKTSSTYADISFFGQWNADSAKHGDEDLNWYGFHAVYNQPEFLLAAQYVETVDAADGTGVSGKNYAGKGYSINGKYRFMKDWGIIARYDNWKLDNTLYGEQETTLAGVTYKYNKNVEFIANYLGDTNYKNKASDQDAFMLTAEVNW